ncbi:MAG TPA: TonB-dependent receptor [Blastocatellia bacterium]|nr:TonB-dependent receptor [Blastocatellia bacterium]
MTRAIVQRFLFVAALLLLSIPLFAQADVTSATVRGTVTDAQGAAVPNATLTIKSTDQGLTRTVQSDSDGTFVFLTLRPGPYELTAQAQGFAQQVVRDIQLTVGQVVSVELKLQVAAVTTEVTITDAAPLIEIERTQQSNTIETRQIQNLPNIGRDFTSYVFTLPGVASSNAPRIQAGSRFTFGSSGFSIGGSNGRSNLITVDGGENEYGSGQLRFAISPEAVQEFQVNRNSFNAEFGFTAGTAVNVVTKSGTNAYHGSAYIFYRSDKTSAKERFVPAFIPAGTRVFQQQVYPGFTFGGPLKKNKLFFFTNYERQKLDLPRFRNYTGNAQLRPSAAQAALLTRLDGSTDATVRAVSAAFRNALTTSATSNAATYNLLRSNEGVINAPYRLNNWITRVDWNVSDRDVITGRFSLARNFNNQLGLDQLESPSNTTDLKVEDQTTLVTWTHNFASSVVNQFRFQFSPNNSARTITKAPGSTALIVGGVGNFNRHIFAPFDTVQDRYQFENNVTWINGNHTFKFGGSYRPVKYNVRNELWFGGEWTFSPGVYPATVLLASQPAAVQAAVLSAICATATPARPASDCTNPTTGAATVAALTAGTQLNAIQSLNFGLPFLYRQGFNNPQWKGTVHYLGGFAQDSWKVNNRFTLDYGFRVDYDGEPSPVPSTTYFSPRLGFAWDVTGNKKTVIRGGGGLFVSPIYYQISYLVNLLNDTGTYINQAFRTPAFPAAQTPAAIWARGVAAGLLPFKAITPTELAAPVTAKQPGRVIIELGPDYKANYSVQANLAIQRQLTETMGIEIAYNMYRGVNIQQPVPVNYREALNPTARCTALNPVVALQPLACQNPALGGPIYEPIDPTITQQTYYSSRGNSIYHGMTLSLTKRFAQHFSFQTSYTWSKTIDDVTDFNTAFYAPFPTRLFLDRALSSFDIRHNFVFSGVFTSPWKNWLLRDSSLAPIISLRSGIPFTLTTGVDLNSDTRAFNDRLFYIGRNTGLGPNFKSFDMRFTRSFRFSGDNPTRLDFTVEAVNLFNRTNYASVRDIIPPGHPDYASGEVRLSGRKDRSAALGEPLAFQAAFDPRRFQFGLKFVF